MRVHQALSDLRAESLGGVSIALERARADRRVAPDVGTDPDQATVHRAMMRQARQRIVVADHGKIGVVGRALIALASEINMLITDTGASQESIAPFVTRGLEVRRE